MEALRKLEAVYADMEPCLLESERIGLIEGIEALCSALNIELSDKRRQLLARWEIPNLKNTLAEIATSRRWPNS